MSSLLSSEMKSEFEKFLTDLKVDGNSKGSYSMAKRVLLILHKMINSNDKSWRNAKELIELIVYVKNELKNADPTESVPSNITLRLLKIIRDEYLVFVKQQSILSNKQKFNKLDYEEHLQKLLINDDEHNFDYTLYDSKMKQFRSAINDGINELGIELDTSAETIASQSLEHIYSNELILTLGKSNSVECFLKYAAEKKRKFQVIVAEGSPFNNGHDLACKLSSYGIHTTLIPDSAIFAIMSRINKVVIGTHSVMANGGLKAVSGAYSVALAAKHYSVPLIVCTAMFKLTPQYLVSHDQVAFNKFSSPHQLLPFKNDRILTKTEVVNPVFDYVPPELVAIFVSNIGGCSPSYVYRLLTELYHSEDYLS